MAQERPDPVDPRGPHEVWNLHVYDNDIESTYVCCGTGWGNAAGIKADDPAQIPDVWQTQGNTFENNRYHVPSGTYPHWTWWNGGTGGGCDFCDWTSWQGFGNDTPTGSMSVGTHVTVPSPPTLNAGPQP